MDERARTVHAYVGFERVITFRAQDPNEEDSVTIVFLADPGLPNGAVIGPNECTDPMPPSIHLPKKPGGVCASARRSVTWRPLPTDVNLTVRVCATPRDNSTLCVPPRSPDERATVLGWYGEEHCVDILVVAPILSWAGSLVPSPPPDAAGAHVPWRFPDQKAYVGCTLTLTVAAVDTSIGLNASAVLQPTPYAVRIEPTSPETLPAGLGCGM